LPDSVSTVFLVGHNNLWTQLSNELSTNNIWHLRTSGVFGVQFETKQWKNVFSASRKDIILIN